MPLRILIEFYEQNSYQLQKVKVNERGEKEWSFTINAKPNRANVLVQCAACMHSRFYSIYSFNRKVSMSVECVYVCAFMIFYVFIAQLLQKNKTHIEKEVNGELCILGENR